MPTLGSSTACLQWWLFSVCELRVCSRIALHAKWPRNGRGALDGPWLYMERENTRHTHTHIHTHTHTSIDNTSTHAAKRTRVLVECVGRVRVIFNYYVVQCAGHVRVIHIELNYVVNYVVQCAGHVRVIRQMNYVVQCAGHVRVIHQMNCVVQCAGHVRVIHQINELCSSMCGSCAGHSSDE